MMKKRGRNLNKGQITVFIIIAILLIVLGVVIFMINREANPTDEQVIDPDVEPLYNYIENCLKITGENAIYHVGQTGGYFFTPDLSTEGGVAIFFSEGQNAMPSKEQIEIELSKYMKEMMYYCTGEYDDFSDYQITSSNLEANAQILDDRVIFDVTYPVSITKGENSYYFDKFTGIEVPSRLGVIYDSIKELMSNQVENKEDVCITCITEISNKNKVYFRMLDYDDNTLLFIVTDKTIQILDQDYEFRYANRY